MNNKLFFAKKALVTTLALALCVGLAISARPGAASAQASLPDLAVSIQATDGAGKPIAQGQTITYANAQKHNIRLIITNNGAGKAMNFHLGMAVRRNGVSVFTHPGEPVTLGPGQSKIFDAQVDIPAGTNNILARLVADTGNLIQESNENNNTMLFSYTAAIVNPPTQ
jgi:subtilase family serine protease